MKTVYIHIGPHKTGSTSLQFLLSERARPLADAGYHYPSACRYHFAHHRLAFAMKGMQDPTKGDKPDLNTEIDLLVAELNKSKMSNFIVSSEEFFSAKPAQIARFAGGLEGFEVRVIAYARRQDDLFYSIYNQAVKEKKNQYRQPLRMAEERSPHLFADLQLYDCISNWAAAFGMGNTKVILFEDGDVIENFLTAVGLPVGKDIVAERSLNHGLSPKALDFFLFSKTATTDAEELSRLYDYAAKRWPSTQRETPMQKDARQEVLNQHRAANDKLFAEFGLGPNRYASVDEPGLNFSVSSEPLRMIDLVKAISESLIDR